MRKWPLLIAFVSIIVIGCGGSSAGGGNTTGTTGTTGTSGTTGTTRAASGVSIPANPGTLDTYFEPGQGRAPGTYSADISTVSFIDSLGNSTYTENPEPPDIYLLLNGYNPQNRIITANIPFPGSSGSTNSRLFTDLQIQINSFNVSGVTESGYGSPLDTTSLGAVLRVTAFPGRFTAVQIYMNDGMFDWTQDPPALTTTSTGQTQFVVQNLDPQTNQINGFLSDYLSFDISHVANPPTLTNFAGNAGRIFVSGDAIAVGQHTPANASATSGFEVLTPFGTMPGTYQTTQAVVGVAPYTLTQPNPTLSFGQVGTITSLQGIWFDSASRITAADASLMITFPSQGDVTTQQCVLIVRNGTTITNMYFGNVYYASSGTKFVIYPIGDVENGSVSGQINGTCSGFTNVSGGTVTTSGSFWQNVRGGTYTITSGSGSGVATSGRMVVYRV